MNSKSRIFLVAFSVALFLGASPLLADSPVKKPRTKHISEDVKVDAPGWELRRGPSGVAPPHPVAGERYQVGCKDINPQADSIIQHDQIGNTWYDFQKNGSMGRMISVTSAGYRHISWMWTAGVYPEPDLNATPGILSGQVTDASASQPIADAEAVSTPVKQKRGKKSSVKNNANQEELL